MGKHSTHLCAGYIASTQARASVFGHAILHRGQDWWRSSQPIPPLLHLSPTQECPPSLLKKVTMLVTSGLTTHPGAVELSSGAGLALALQLPSNGILPALEVPYNTFCYSSVGSTLVPWMLRPIGLPHFDAYKVNAGDLRNLDYWCKIQLRILCTNHNKNIQAAGICIIKDYHVQGQVQWCIIENCLENIRTTEAEGHLCQRSS